MTRSLPMLGLALIALLLVATSCATHDHRTGSSQDIETRVVPLKFAAAAQREPVASKSLGSNELRVVADPRKNSIILSGSADAVASAEREVATLDVDVKK